MQAWLPLVFLAGGLLLLAGCGKKTSSVPAATVGMATDSPAQLAQLTQLVRKFGMEHQRVPQSLNDLMTPGYLVELPAAPAGQQFVIDQKHMQVVLKNKP